MIGAKKTKLIVWFLVLMLAVSVLPASVRADGTITVTVSVLGDGHHNSDQDGNCHTYAAGNLETWVSPTAYSDVPEGRTVWELLQRVFEENGIQVRSVYNESYGSEYIQGLTPPGGSDFLCEKDNGDGSGWMYKINGQDVETGISNKVLRNGDQLVFHYTDNYTKENYGGNEDEEAALAVEDLIDAIGTVTEDSADAISQARSAYDVLSDNAKALVTNYDTLVAAEAAYAALIDKASVEEVEALIAAIGTVTENSGDAITAARNAYNSLTDEQKSQVSNVKTLTDAEEAYAQIIADAQAAKDQAAADAVIKKIKAIGKVKTSDEKAIKEAKEAYNALTKKQKKLVTNYSDLTDAEAALAVEKKIAAIGKVTLKSEDAIKAARKEYDRLTKAQKNRVSSLKTLTSAEKKLEELKKAEEEQEETSEDGFSGKGTKSNPYLIKNLSDLKKLQKAVNTKGKNFSGKYFKMTADITIPADWTPIGTLKKGTSSPADGKNILPFSGTFDGGGHLLTVASGGKCLFGYIRGATIKNLNIYGTKIASDGLVANYTVDYGESGTYTGSASRTATFENITIKKGTKTLYSGIIGADSSGGSGKYSQSSSQNLLYFSNCTVESGVTIGYGKNKSCIGSLAGHFNGTMENCRSAASVYGKNYVGGLVGYKDTSMGDFSVDSCSFSGSVTASGNYAGGIVGSGYNDESAPNARCVCIENCTVSGTVSGSSGVGGILGGEPGIWQAWENGIGYIRNNQFTGTVSGSENVGAILGYYRSLNRYTIIENNFYAEDCGAKKGIGSVLYVDSDLYSNDNAKPLGWKNGVYRFDTSEDDVRRIKQDLNPDSAYTNIARKNHNRTDDPLGKDASKLTSTFSPEKVYITKLTTSGSYKTEYSVGDSMDLDGLKVTAHYSDGTTQNIPLKKIKKSGFSSKEPGTGKITLSYEGCSVLLSYTVKPKEDPSGGKTTVTVTVLGDSVHDSDEDGKVHGLAMGGLSTWVSATTVEAKTSETVWDVLQRVFAANNITPVTSGNTTIYISALKRGGVTLGEFTNGAKSGWMYTVNGSHPLQGVSQRYVKNGDKIIFHYTDDYTKEEGSESSSGGSGGGNNNDEKEKDRNSSDSTDKEKDKDKQTTPSPLTPAQQAASVQNAEKIYKATGDYLESLGDPAQGTVGGRWMAMGLARSGRKVAESYYDSVAAYVAENIDENERLHFAKSTENSGEIAALTALGYDVTDVEGHNLLTGLTDLSYVQKQGINGTIWALIAFDTGQYEIPQNPDAKEQVTRENLIQALLNAQLSDGGWALSGSSADSDITGMTLTALAPYYETDPKVKKAVDKALERLSEMQNKDGSFSTFGGDGLTPTSESTAQVLVALSALGIDAASDARFVKNGNSVLSALCEYYVEGSGFKHLSDGEVDGMATEQAYYALAAYFRMKEGKTSLYDMTDVPGIGPEKEEKEEEPESKPAEETPADEPEEEAFAVEESGAAEDAETAELTADTDEEDEEVALVSDTLAKERPEKNPVPALILVAAVAAALIWLVIYMGRKKRKADGDE